MLEVDRIDAYYGQSQALFGMSLEVGVGEVVSLMGRNGMGKTTTIRSIMGLLEPQAGSVRFLDHELRGLAPYRVAKLGLGLVPEGRQIFPNLTVRENLIATTRPGDGAREPWTLARVYGLFPRLEDRQSSMGDQLSGGEQQMLAIGRALMTNPKLLLLDEATEGLAPLIRTEIWSCLAGLKDVGQAILVIDKNVEALTKICDRHFIVEKGHLVWSGNSTELRANPDVQHQLLGV
ncbi:MAG: ABC transporter ATP-binding protein [Alphaproteobacteria bacterium]|jgi:branched-chain amino acid transport system ATP-binding protein|nr:ABC transporter ATP-binding protein [Alphaproteobacteria bacterium]MDP6255460.1 ABC transporter ATP-binding protein [Alphaproteobacteria bacterium]MDP7055034.1 ABC transporter ATP-binding protein [Alphaproteobacteria bacterium]MDP7231192.1 ABC transporter ATP-binding protein [Alphaproteobacteria bacterium]MDP7462386.1 ABC transporter ATP-binding protein [Alphaproteobacteria bacterium]|tara:strand:- start:3620 stop:4321 length:702 start_codon:yes stop_codon:yes gene_type:complete